MRFAMTLAAVAALWVQPVTAATIVQVAGNQSPVDAPGSFDGFDYGLGILNSVSLEIAGTERRMFGANYPPGAVDPITIDWSIDGDANFTLTGSGTGSTQVAVPIAGSGQVVTSESWSWEISAAGNRAFQIDPSLIPDIATSAFGPDLFVSFSGPGFFDFSDTEFSTSAPIQISTAPGDCRAGSGEVRCADYQYRLTYDYTAFGSVPEPSTWALMIVGFGLIGASLRRRSVGVRKSIA